jgi:hypothetical protein
MILANSNSGRFHPIIYVEDPDAKLPEFIVYKSKRHHVEGFDNRYEAMREVSRMQLQLIKNGYKCQVESHTDLLWTDKNEPSDKQIRYIETLRREHVEHVNCATQAILQAQLRDKFGCVVLAHMTIVNGKMGIYDWWRYHDGMIECSNKPWDEEYQGFETYEDALQAGIEEAFILLEH